jgi:hypothetical protein
MWVSQNAIINQRSAALLLIYKHPAFGNVPNLTSINV